MTTARYRVDRQNRVWHGKTLVGRVEPYRPRDRRAVTWTACIGGGWNFGAYPTRADAIKRVIEEHKQRSEGR